MKAMRSALVWDSDHGVGLHVRRDDEVFTVELRHDYAPARVVIVLPVRDARQAIPRLLADISLYEEIFAALWTRYCDEHHLPAKARR